MTRSRRSLLMLIPVVTVLLLGAISSHHASGQVTSEHRVYTGHSSSGAVRTGGWHAASKTQSALTGLDISASGDPLDWTRFLSKNHSGTWPMDAYRVGPGASTTCSGSEVWIYRTNGTKIGEVRYIHIDPWANTPYYWQMNGNAGWWTTVSMGTISANQDTECPHTDPHLHQAEDLALAPKNQGIPWSVPYGGSNTWMFKYIW